MHPKPITIVIAGAQGKEYRDVQILPGTQARDLLRQLGLDGFQLSRPDGPAMGRNDDLYAALADVPDGFKLFASRADVEAGPEA